MTVILHSHPGDVLNDEELQPWRDVPVAVAVDQAPEARVDIAIRPINPPGKQPRLFGRAVTVLCDPPDFGSVLHAVDIVGPGDVLVIAAGGHGDAAMIGEILCGHLRSKGGTGMVCDGAVRDVAALAGWSNFSVFTRFINAKGPEGAERGSVQAPVNIGGRLVSPGDLIIGDDDGLAALSPDLARGRIGEARKKIDLEEKWVASLARGTSIADTFDLSPAAGPAGTNS